VTPDQTSTAFLRWLAIIASQDRDDVHATDCAFAFRFTGNAAYAAQGLALAEALVAQAEADIAAGRNPDMAGDSYLGVGDAIQTIAIAFAWCNPSASQRTRFKALADQAVFNIWNAAQAKWGTRAAPWNSWATDDPMNNYYYSFLRATMLWALASSSTSIVKDGKTAFEYLRTDRLPLVVAAMATLAGGGSEEGTGYGTSHMGLFELYKWWKDSTGEDLTDPHMTNSIYVWVHATIPECVHFWPIGSQTRDSTAAVFDYHLKLVELAMVQTADTAARNAARWWFAHILDGDGDPYTRMSHNFMAFWDLFDRGGASTPPAALTYRAAEMGPMMGRTSWTDPGAVWCGTLMGEYSQSHAHPEQGSVSLANATGWLTVTNNINSHSGINGEGHEGRDKNVVLFLKGGAEQEQGFGTTQVLSYASNPATGEYHAIGEMASLYASNSGVNSWQRSVDFVGGKATVTDTFALAAGTSAVQQWNTTPRPTIAGNVVTAGHLRLTVLSPSNATISITDMHALDADYTTPCFRINVAGSTTGYKTLLEVLP